MSAAEKQKADEYDEMASSIAETVDDPLSAAQVLHSFGYSLQNPDDDAVERFKDTDPIEMAYNIGELMIEIAARLVGSEIRNGNFKAVEYLLKIKDNAEEDD